MKKEIFTACYDENIQIEAYQLKGIVQSFPNHFHEHYTLGFIEQGHRLVSCKNQEYTLSAGDIVLFNPKDNHTCTQIQNETFTYGGLMIRPEVMQQLTEKVTGISYLPRFTENIVHHEELYYYLRNQYKLVTGSSIELEKEENLFFLMSLVLTKYSTPFEEPLKDCQEEIERACEFMNSHYAEHITLEQICQYAGLSKSTLLRSFTKSKGITPYRYLVTVRINNAKKLLEQGILPIDAALQTGFSDQSHFTNFFTTFIGISPGAYKDIFMQREN